MRESVWRERGLRRLRRGASPFSAAIALAGPADADGHQNIEVPLRKHRKPRFASRALCCSSLSPLLRLDSWTLPLPQRRKACHGVNDAPTWPVLQC